MLDGVPTDLQRREWEQFLISGIIDLSTASFHAASLLVLGKGGQEYTVATLELGPNGVPGRYCGAMQGVSRRQKGLAKKAFCWY